MSIKARRLGRTTKTYAPNKVGVDLARVYRIAYRYVALKVIVSSKEKEIAGKTIEGMVQRRSEEWEIMERAKLLKKKNKNGDDDEDDNENENENNKNKKNIKRKAENQDS